MAFVNLPPNLQDMFYGLSDRIMKLETGPNQAMYTAEAAQGSSVQAYEIAISAQSVADQAQIDAATAEIQATNAAAQATLASTQATAAQASADSKNTITYSASTPSGVGTLTGDVWFQYQSPSMNIIGQWVWNGSSWQVSPISNTVIANLDAGKITAGTITGIEYNNGSGTFRVTPAGALTATSATIKGVVTATTGYFGDTTGSNYWQIGATGLTAVGSGTITGGLIQGSSITVPNSAAWKFAVNSAGSLQAVNANITGAITATSGSFTGNIYGASGNIGGWNFNSIGLYNSAATASINAADGAIVSTGTSSLKALSINGATISTYALAVSGDSTFTGNITATGSITAQTNLNANGSMTLGVTNQFQYLSSSGTLRSAYTWGKSITTSTPRAMQINSVGDFGTTASTRRKKHEIANYTIDSAALLQLPVRQFKYLPELDPDQNTIHGFIAEEAQDLGLNELIQFDSEGIPDYFAYEKLPTFLLQLVQELDARLKTLEGN